ncbi:hypothetical protein AtNW77_MTg0321571 (mitochondrion) [Arabidopsis thaliana]
MKVLGPTFNPLRASDRTRSNGPFHAGPGQWICALPAGAFSLSHFRSQGGIDILDGDRLCNYDLFKRSSLPYWSANSYFFVENPCVVYSTDQGGSTSHCIPVSFTATPSPTSSFFFSVSFAVGQLES